MSTKENRSIAYIYNEMDPSEKLEFERDLENDSDLLIEVESFKKITRNLNRLESINPPTHVVDAVYQSAKKNTKESGKKYWKPIMYSAAALLLVGVTSGIFLVIDTADDADSVQTESASVATGNAQIYSQPVSTSPESEDKLQPWVDNNEILYFGGQAASENRSVADSIKNESLRKLTPVNPSGNTRRQQQLQLTGSHN